MKTSFLLLFCLIANINLIACNCSDFVPIFCHDADTSDHIALVEIIEMPEYSWAKFKVIENINKTISEDTIDVLGQDGLNCALGLGIFEIGDTIVANLNSGNFINSANDLNYQWMLWHCNLRYLRYSAGEVIGRVTNEITNQDYETFKTEISFCYDFVSSASEIPDFEVELFPNPAVSNISIQSQNIRIEHVAIYNSKGVLVSTFKGVNDAIENIPIDDLNNGVYFMSINTSEGILRKKFIKM